MKLYYLNGSYEGDVKWGEPNGHGKRVWTYGDVYIGEWKDGKCHGKGKYTYANGNVYEGEWKNGKRHGKGKCTFKNGEVYDGNFAENIPRGKGIKTYADGTEIIGVWTDWNNADNAVRKRGKTVEYGSLKNGEFIVGEVKEYEISDEDEVYETPDEIDVICRITDDLYELCGGDADKFEASPEFETSINKLLLTLISGEGCETRAAAQESAAKLIDIANVFIRLTKRAEISLAKLGDEDFNKLKKDLSSDGADE